VAEELIGPVVVKGTPWKVYPTGIYIIARNDGDIGDGGGVGYGQAETQKGEGE